MKTHIPFPPLSRFFIAAAIAASLASTSIAQIASDNGGNYGGGWTDESNGGSGFGGWGIAPTLGTGNAAGVFIGDPSHAGVSGMSTSSFGMYADPAGTGTNIDASRGFSSSLADGQTFSFLWGLNWDSGDASSNRGFNLNSGGTQLININMSDSDNLTINGNLMFDNYGSNAFTLNFEQVSSSSIRVYGTGRDGSETYDNTFTELAGRADNFSFYFNGATKADAPNADNRQMYFNNLSIVPEPSTYALLGLGAAFGLWQLRRRRLS
jgi:hypothetical protein